MSATRREPYLIRPEDPDVQDPPAARRKRPFFLGRRPEKLEPYLVGPAGPDSAATALARSDAILDRIESEISRLDPASAEPPAPPPEPARIEVEAIQPELAPEVESATLRADDAAPRDPPPPEPEPVEAPPSEPAAPEPEPVASAQSEPQPPAPEEPVPVLPGDDGKSRSYLCPTCGETVDKSDLAATLYHQRPNHRRRD